MKNVVNSKTVFGAENLFSVASRERCINYFKNLRTIRREKPLKPTAAVLVPMCVIGTVPSLLYTVRSPLLRSNSGVISFPGGKIDKDEAPIQTALRETTEEIGLSPTKIDVWGQGPAFPGKIDVTPVIGAVSDLKQEDLSVNEQEVYEVFGVALETLCNPTNHFYTQFNSGFILPVFIADQYKIWGLTAYITHCFLSSILPKEVYTNDWMKRKIVLNNNLRLK